MRASDPNKMLPSLPIPLARAARAFLRGFPFNHIPLYVGVAVLASWLGYLTIMVLDQHHPEATETAWTIANGTKFLVYLYVVYPMLLGLFEVRREFRGDDS